MNGKHSSSNSEIQKKSQRNVTWTQERAPSRNAQKIAEGATSGRSNKENFSKIHNTENPSKDVQQQSLHLKQLSQSTDQISWTTGDLDSEYLYETQAKRTSRSKLIDCAADLMLNADRLTQIQKILYDRRSSRCWYQIDY